MNLYPRQIENVLSMRPKLADAAVIGVPNPDLGEEVQAVVELASGVAPSDSLTEELKASVSDRLGKQLTPRSVYTRPRLPTGKLYKQALRDRYWPGSSRNAPPQPQG